ncbi:MAG: LysM peptidoglycan-binding domain-containing protein [Pseudomonadota bacterium]|nr:LysM peptidoglycan-binding domain-containing protein [Pseudomonadota bacterium]
MEFTIRSKSVLCAITVWTVFASFLMGMVASVIAQELPRPAAIEPDILFWTRVYTEIDTSSGFIHDTRDLSVVYRTIQFEDGASRRSRNRQMQLALDDIRNTLRTLSEGNRNNLTGQEQHVLSLWPQEISNEELTAAASRVRFQLGQADRFRAGYIRAGRWKSYIRNVLREQGVPAELVALPHVESSFDPTAYSKVGAAGMWQFTRSTGLRYMRIDHIVDERRDPYFSTVAAARLLRDNYDVLQNWALAITAYNHGQAGMRNAVRRMGTDRIEVILREYDGRAFGFASRNFYVAFLAASDVDAKAEEYFGPLSVLGDDRTTILETPDFLTTSTLTAAFDMSHRELRSWNPSLSDAVWNEDKFVPKGFELRLPVDLVPNSSELMVSVPDSQRFTAQKPDIMHRVQRGDTVSDIAERYRVSQASLVALNNLRSRNFIREGQVLRLPGNDGTVPITLAEQDGVMPLSADSTYVVRAGDSIDRIARMYGVSPGALQAQNGIINANRIYVGQELQISGSLQTALTLPPEVRVELGSGTDVVLSSPAVEATPVRAQPPYASEVDQLAVEAALAVIVDNDIVELESSSGGAAGDPLGEPLETNVLASVQAEMAADPSDYLVREDQTIEVQALETLGHYADWLEIRTQRLRDVNNMPFRQAVLIGNRLKLDFSQVSVARFEGRRIAYQRQTQESFFLAYQVTNTQDHVIRSGESLWELALQTYEVPVWLIRQYNPDLDLDRVAPGTVVKFPQLRPISPGDNAQAANYTN